MNKIGAPRARPQAATSATHEPASATPTPAYPGVVNSQGDRYPPEATGLVEQLPKRVIPNNGERTVGVAKLGDRPLPPIESGYDPVWTPKVQQ